MPVGLSKPVKKLVQEKLPDLSSYQDISEFIEKGGLLSESEAEFDGPENQVKLEEDYKSRGSINLKSVDNSTSAIRLSEIGPRLKLKLVKIEEGVCDGEVLYHDLIKKTPEELKVLRENLKQRKKEEKSQKLLKQKSQKLNGKNKKKNKEDDDEEAEGEESKKDKSEENEDYDEDLEYYKQEIGQEPDSEFLNQRKKSLKRKRDSNEKDEFSNKKNMHVNYYLNGDLEAKKKESDDDNNKSQNESVRNKNKKIVKFNNKKENNLNHKNGEVKAKFFGFSKKKLQTKK